MLGHFPCNFGDLSICASGSSRGATTLWGFIAHVKLQVSSVSWPSRLCRPFTFASSGSTSIGMLSLGSSHSKRTAWPCFFACRSTLITASTFPRATARSGARRSATMSIWWSGTWRQRAAFSCSQQRRSPIFFFLFHSLFSRALEEWLPRKSGKH